MMLFFFGQAIVSIIPLALIVSDKLKGGIYPPFVHLAVAWGVTLASYKFIHHLDWWHSFASWSLQQGF